MNEQFKDIKRNLELTIDNYQKSYKEQEQKLKDMKERHRQTVYAIVASGGNPDEIKQLAIYAYIFDGHVDSTTLCGYAGEKSPNGWAKHLKDYTLTKTCKRCDNQVVFTVRSRSQIKYDKYGKPIDAGGGVHDYLCVDCNAKLKKEQEEHAMRIESQKDDRQKEIERLRSLPYPEYLKTEHWETVRKSALRRARYKCQLCYKEGTLHVHHKTYMHKGYEYNSDLIVLCPECHAKFHDKLENTEHK